jgi:hypothetical protein
VTSHSVSRACETLALSMSWWRCDQDVNGALDRVSGFRERRNCNGNRKCEGKLAPPEGAPKGRMRTTPQAKTLGGSLMARVVTETIPAYLRLRCMALCL